MDGIPFLKRGMCMIERIILFTKGIETLSYFSEQMGKTFERLDYEVFYFDQCDSYDSLSDLLAFAKPKATAAVSFNFQGCSGEDYLIDSKGIHLFDAREIPYINIVVDHPFYYHKFLPSLPERYIQISIDREHEAYLKQYFPEIRRGPFLPLAGTSLWESGTLPTWEERPLDIVFTGNYTPPSQFDPVITRINDEYTEFYRGIIRDFINHPHLGMDKGIRRHLLEEVEDINEAGVRDAMPNMIMIDLYVRHYFRGKVVQTLVDAGMKVHCVGAGWHRLECKHPENLIQIGAKDSLGCLEQLSLGKISLNVMPWFKDGAHDRVFNSMLNGAVCCTDWSRYLQETLEDGSDLMLYELDALEQLPEQLHMLLADRMRWETMQQQAYRTAAEAHTWAHRAGQLHKEVLSKIP